jgi:protein-S-isoprenylcysteine O-methyltransferase Ste14
VATPFVEEPWLAARYGAEYAAYRRVVPRFFGFRQLRAAT